MKNSTKKRIGALGVACALCLTMAASFAFFTDRADATASATAGNINLVFTDLSAAKESKHYNAVVDGEGNVTGVELVADGDLDTDVDTQARDNVWTAEKLVVDNGVLNPGDVIDMGYKVANTGNKSIDVKQQIVLTSSVALTDAAEEYKITIAGQDITPVKSDDDKTLTYELAEIILNGTIEKEGGVTVAEQEYDVAMVFDRLAKNKFMDSTVSVKLDIQAKQHRNTTDADWIKWATYETSVEQIAD